MTIPLPVKREVLKRSGGKCEACGLDVEQLIQDTIDANAEKRVHIGIKDAIKIIGEQWNLGWNTKHLVELDHTIPRALGGEDTVDNLKAICRRCHNKKTRKKDIKAIAKALRLKTANELHQEKMREKAGL